MIRLKNEPNYQAIHQAFDYQKRAAEFIKDLDYAAIFHEQGLGKTKIAIDLALAWIGSHYLDTVLVVTKKALSANWVNEFSVHSHLKPKVLVGNPRIDGGILLSPTRIIIAHYELIKGMEASIRMFCQTRNVGVFLDESQKIKNPTSSLTQSFFRLAPFFKKRVILTGTPIANRPYDIWAQIYFLDGGESFGGDFKKFKVGCDLSNEMSEDRLAQEDFIISIQEIHPKIRNFVVRETKDGCELDLPPKNYFSVECDFEKRQGDLYLGMKDEFKVYVHKDGSVIEDDAEEILKRILRLQQICSVPSLIDESYKGRPGKLDELDEIIDSILSRKEKVIVWTQFTGTADYLTNYLKFRGVKKVTGKMSIEQRNNNLDAFKKDKDINCLIATYGAAKEGLTLTVANNAIFFDRSLSLDDYVQSQDRIHRISQQKDCNFYLLTIRKSIESWVNSLLTAKMCSAGLALNDISLEMYRECMSFDFGRELLIALGVDDV